MRFDRTESPSHVNEGQGWTEEKAAEWLEAHGMHGDDLSFDDGYIRAKQFEAGRTLGGEHIAEGILVMRAEKRES